MPYIIEGEIDRDRIITNSIIPDEYLCPICQYLLWKPRSCSSCQHLFCEKCLKLWIQNSNNQNTCPYRCQSIEYRQAPPYLRSLLSYLDIRCRNAEFGCRQILSYDQLEHHENVTCEYLTQKCLECEKYVLISKLYEHQQIPGLCIPCPVKCTICQNYIEKYYFSEHFYQCCQQRIDEVHRVENTLDNLLRLVAGQPVRQTNPGQIFLESWRTSMQLIDQQLQMSRFPTNLKGLNQVRRARERNCGHFYHILIILKFILLNWSKAPFFLLMIPFTGFVVIGRMILDSYIIFSSWSYTNIYRRSIFIPLLSALCCYGTYFGFQYLTDTIIILIFGIATLLWGCSDRTPLEVYEINALFSRTKVCIGLCGLVLLMMKICLLLMRFYYRLIPTYIAADLFTIFNFYLGSKMYYFGRNANANPIITTTPQNQLIMPLLHILLLLTIINYEYLFF